MGAATRLSRLGYPLALATLLALSFMLRWSELEKTTGAPNIEASYHVLLTISALSESPFKNHWLLPTVSLGRQIDKGVPWGETIPTVTGDYVYTSFAPPGFVVPYLAFQVLGFPKSLKYLAIFNFVLQSLACALLYVLLNRILAREHAFESDARLAALVGVSLQIFSTEALLSFGLIYWSQQLFQIVFLATLILLYSILQRDGRDCRPYVIGLLVLCFLGAWIEWTGFVFNAGLFIVLLYKGRKAPQYRVFAIKLALATIAAAGVIVLHYAAAAGLLETLQAFVHRFLARSVGHTNLHALPRGYLRSYGLLIPLVLGAALFSIWAGRLRRPQVLDWNTGIGIVFFAAAFPAVENLVLQQHATEFSFDRLKLVIPAAILLAYAFAQVSRRARAGISILLVFALFQNYFTYEQILSTRASWREVDRTNRQLVARVREIADLRCSMIASNIKVRGYTNLLLHRAVYEYLKPADLQSLMQKGPNCSGVYLVGKNIYRDLPQYSEAVVYKQGNAHHITAQ